VKAWASNLGRQKDSSARDSAFPSTPGSRREMASTITKAASSPPVSRKTASVALIETMASGCREDHPRVRGAEGFQGCGHHIHPHDHAGTTPIRSVVDYTMAPEAMVAEVVDPELQVACGVCPPQDRMF
jgi:hypothetical protein